MAHVPLLSLVLLVCFFIRFAVFWPFAPLTLSWGQKMLSISFFYSKESVTDAEVEPWLGCHSYLLPITSFAVWHATPILQWSIDKLIMNMIHSEIELILINDIIFFHFLSLPCGSEERRLPSVCKARPVISVSFLPGKEKKERWAQKPVPSNLFSCVTVTYYSAESHLQVPRCLSNVKAQFGC